MIQSERITKSIRSKKRLNYLFVGAIALVELILLATIIIGAWKMKEPNPFYIIAFTLMLLWVGVLIAYFAWAIYFYNINLGLTNQDWAEIRERRQNVPDDESQVPTDNPNADQTLGLPPGTLRGAIALSLLVGGIAMAIASLGMDYNVKADSLMVDHFDFFKTAFLMMIAFYFGNKALETLGYKSQSGIIADQQASASARTAAANDQAPAHASAVTSTDIKNTLKQGATDDTAKEEDDDFENSNAVQ